MKTWAAAFVLMISLLNMVTFGFDSKSEGLTESFVGISLSESSPHAKKTSSNQDCHVPCPSVHVCHLGHCDFVVGLLSGLEPPKNGFSMYQLFTTSFTSIVLPANKKPPKV